MTTHPASRHGDEPSDGSEHPLSQYPLVVTSDIGEAESRGSPLLAEYRLGVRHQLSFQARVNGYSLGGVDLRYLNFGSTEVDVASAAMRERFGIVIPLTGAMRVRYKVPEFDVVCGSSAVIISPDAEFRMQWDDSFSCLVLRVQKSDFVALAHSMALRAEVEDLSFEPLISRPASLRSVRGALQVLHECVARAGSVERVPPLMASRVREQLITTLLMVQPNDMVEHLYQPSVPVGHRAVREAVDLVESNAGAIATVAELARRVGVTTRSLQIGFQRELGISPASYMHDVRFARAHGELLTLRKSGL